MHLTIEFGNTNYKIVLLEGQNVIQKWITPNSEPFDMLSLAAYKINKGLYAGSGKIQEKLLDQLSSLHIPMYTFDKYEDTPFTYSYRSPETLGTDRILNAIGATQRRPEGSHLIIDIGTCLTLSYISNLDFSGGSISPGITMRAQSLHEHTLALPKIEITSDNNDIVGQTTAECIQSGILNGLWGEIMHDIQYYVTLEDNLNIYFTGGGSSVYQNRIEHLMEICHNGVNKNDYLYHDFAFFSLFYLKNKIKCNIFAESNLIFKGMNHILLQK